MYTAWIICITVTAVLLLSPGIGGARISNSTTVRTVPETLGIALAAPLADVLAGILLS